MALGGHGHTTEREDLLVPIVTVTNDGPVHQHIVEEKEVPLFDSLATHLPERALANEDPSRYE